GTNITNYATVRAHESDPNTSNNYSSCQTQVSGPPPPNGADLTITKTDSPDPVAVGTHLYYLVTVTNNGPETANDVTVTDTLPLGVDFVGVSPSQGTWTRDGRIVVIHFGSVAPFAQPKAYVVVTPTVAEPIVNSAVVGSITPDPNPSNNGA